MIEKTPFVNSTAHQSIALSPNDNLKKFVNMNSNTKNNTSSYKTKNANSRTGSPVKQMANILKEN